jgi:hypothetical protein
MKPTLCLLLLLSACAHLPRTHDTEALERVVERFRTSLIAKDGPALRELFVNQDTPWLGVSKTPRAGRAKVREIDTPERFIDFIVSSPDRLEETVRHLQITSDGEVATVSFDYEFWSNSTLQNRGLECWQLVRSEAGWKIAFLVYSIGG